MSANIKRFQEDLLNLRNTGMLLECSMIKDLYGEEKLKSFVGDMPADEFAKITNKIPPFKKTYEAWYSECLAVLKQLLPNRLDDFKRQYERAKGRKNASYETYVIEDYMLNLQASQYGEVKVDSKAAFPKLQNQTCILAAAQERFKSSLFEIKQLVQADLFDSEILSARELHKNKFYRASGAVAGVVLEKHLAQICRDHDIKITKKNPSISDFNEAMRAGSVIDMPQWRHISFLADIRNICDHNKEKEPSAAQVTDLLDGVDKVLKTIS